MIRRMFAAFAIVALAACASMEAKTPAQRIYAIQADYNGALAVAVAYESQPRCTAIVLTKCSSTSVVVELRKADDAAYSAIRAAQNTVRTPGVAESTFNLALTGAINAVGVMRNILKTYNIGG